MKEKWDAAMKEVVRDFKRHRKNLQLYHPLVQAFEESEEFEVYYVTWNSMRVTPTRKDLTAKDISILLDEILFPLEFMVTSESVDSSDLNIWLGDYPNRFIICLGLKGYTKCRMVELSSKTRIITCEDKTYAIECEA